MCSLWNCCGNARVKVRWFVSCQWHLHIDKAVTNRRYGGGLAQVSPCLVWGGALYRFVLGRPSHEKFHKFIDSCFRKNDRETLLFNVMDMKQWRYSCFAVDSPGATTAGDLWSRVHKWKKRSLAEACSVVFDFYRQSEKQWRGKFWL